MITPRKYDIWLAELEHANGEHIQCGKRPVVIIQNDIGNYHSPNTIVAAITTARKKFQPTRFSIPAGFCGMRRDSTIAAENVCTIGKENLVEYIGTLINTEYTEQLDNVLKVSFDL